MNRLALVAAGAALAAAGLTFLVLHGRDDGVLTSVRSDREVERRIARIEQLLHELTAEPLSASFAQTERDTTAAPLAANTGRRVLAPAGPTSDTEMQELRQRLDVLESLVTAIQRDPVQRGYDYLASSSPELRRRGVRLLESFARHDPQARAAIRGMLRDAAPDVREQALDALADIDDVAAIPLVQELLEDTAPDVRREAVDALENLMRQSPDGRTATATAALVQRVHDADARVREQAIDALGDLGAAAATSALLAALEDPTAGVRDEAIDALGRIGDAAALPRLRTLHQSAQGELRLDAAIALARIGDPEPFRQEAVQLVETATSHTSDRERARAIDVLGEVAPQDYEAVLKRALEDPSARVRREAERALRRLERR